MAFDTIRKRVMEVNRDLAFYMQAVKNPWQAAPTYHVAQQDYEIEKVNEHIAPDEILLTIEPDAKLASTGAKLIFEIGPREGNDELVADAVSVGSKYARKFRIPGMRRNIRSRTVAVKITDQVYPLIVAICRCCFSKDLVNAGVSLAMADSKNQVSEKLSSSSGGSLEIALRMHRSLKGTESEIISLNTVIIDRYVKPFKSPPPPERPAGAKPKKAAAKKAPEGKAQPQAQVAAGADPPLPKELPTPLPKSVRPIDVFDPEDVANMIVATNLEKRLEEFKAMANKSAQAGTKIPENAKKKLMLMTRNYAVTCNK